jgi:hypothetical protein
MYTQNAATMSKKKKIMLRRNKTINQAKVVLKIQNAKFLSGPTKVNSIPAILFKNGYLTLEDEEVFRSKHYL